MMYLDIVDTLPRKLFVNMIFGEWLRQQIDAKGWSDAELARRSHFSPTHISNLIRNFSPNTKDGTAHPTRSTVEKIAKALGASVDEALQVAGYAPKRPALPPDAVLKFEKEMSKLTEEQQQRVWDRIDFLIRLAQEENGS